MRKKLFFIIFILFFLFGLKAFGEDAEELELDKSNIFYQFYGNWAEEEWQRWVKEDVYVLITKKQRELLFATPLQLRWLRAQELWRFWGQASGMGEEQFFYIYQNRLKVVKESFGSTTNDRARIFLLFGPAEQIVAVNSSSSRQTPSLATPDFLTCKYLGNLEIWIWGAVPRLSSVSFSNAPVVAVFYKISATTFRLWDPQISSFSVLQQKGDYYSAEYESPSRQIGSPLSIVRECVNGDTLIKLINLAQLWLEKTEARPFFFHFFPQGVRGSSVEEYLNFSRFSTLSSPGEQQILRTKEVIINFGKRPSSNTRAREIEAKVTLINQNLKPYSVAAKELIQIKIYWAIFKEGDWIPWLNFETTHTYTSPFPEELVAFARFNLTAGRYVLRIKVADTSSKAIGLVVREFDVTPTLEVKAKDADAPHDQKEIADQSFQEKLVPLQILGDVDGPYSIGVKKFVVLTANSSIKKVAFFLDEELVATVNRPPFEVEIDLGSAPRRRIVKAVAYNEEEKVVGEAVKLVNVGENRFFLKLEKPVIEKNVILVQGQIYVPREKKLEKIEVFLGDELKSTVLLAIGKNKFLTTIPNDREKLFIRAVATLDDGSKEEDIQFLVQGFGSVAQVIGVELPVTVLKNGQPVVGLQSKDFIVYESVEEKREEQIISSIRTGKDVPLNIGVLFDVSSSMAGSIRQNQEFVINFLKQVMKNEDRAFLMAFTEVPQVLVGITSNIKRIEEAIIPLGSTGWTSLYDTIATSIVQFSGLKGRKVLLVFTDGDDTASKIKFKELLSALRHSPISIYFLTPPSITAQNKKELEEIAKLTAGRVFIIEKFANKELEKIEEEIRTGYVLSYTSTFSNSPVNKFRKVEVIVKQKKAIVKTIDGYYPE